MAHRLQAMGTPGYKDGFRLSLMPERLEQPVKRKKPTMYFVNSMSDLFHEDVPFEYIDQVMAVIQATPHHTYQILTKRAGRMAEYYGTHPIAANIWQGVTVEDRKYGKPRIDELRKVGAKIRFLSVEPLLEELGELDLSGIHWVIVGGESGNQARPMKQAWADHVRHQCEAQGASFFFKQWGTWGADGVKRNKHLNGRLLNGQQWDAYPGVDAGY